MGKPHMQRGDQQDESSSKLNALPQRATEDGVKGIKRREAKKTGSGAGVMGAQVTANGKFEVLPSHVEPLGLAEVDAADESGRPKKGRKKRRGKGCKKRRRKKSRKKKGKKRRCRRRRGGKGR